MAERRKEKDKEAPNIDSKHHDDWEQEEGNINQSIILKDIVTSFREAAKRSRSALLVVLIASLIISGGIFNYEFSWLRTREYRAHNIDNNKELKNPIEINNYLTPQEAIVQAINRNSENDKPDYKRHLYHDVFDGEFKVVNIPALGIEFYIEDLPIMGSVGLLVVLIWFYFSKRRERGIVLHIYRKTQEIEEDYKDADDNKKEILRNRIEYLKQSVTFNQILSKEDIEDESFFQKTHHGSRNRYYGRNLRTALFPINLNYSFLMNLVFAIYNALFYFICIFLPIITICFVLQMDTKETFEWNSPKHKVPNEVFYTTFFSNNNSLDTLFNEESCRPKMEKFSDSIKLIYYKKIDSIRKNKNIDTITKQDTIIKIAKMSKDTLDYFAKKYFKDTSLISHIKYAKKSWDKIEEEDYHPSFMDVEWELKYIHGLFPVILTFLCLWISINIMRITYKQDRDLKRMQMISQTLDKKEVYISNDKGFFNWANILFVFSLFVFFIYAAIVLH